MRQRSTIVWTVALCCVAAGAAGSDPAPLPTPDLGSLQEPYATQAAAALSNAQAEPDNADAVGSLGMTLHALGRTEDAAACYARAHALEPSSFRWGYYLAVMLEAQGRRADALAALQEVRDSSGDYAPFHVREGELLRAEGRLDAAAESFDRALALEPRLPSAHLGLGRVRADRKQWEDAIVSYGRAVELARNYAAAHYALGLAYRRTGEREKAARALDRYQRLRPLPPPSFDPLLEAVNALVGDDSADVSADFTPGQRRAFVEELERAVAADPGLVSAHANLIALYFQLGRPAQAKEHYRRALEIDPAYPEAHYNWGGVQLARRDEQAALAAFEKALAADPAHSSALVQSGLLLERGGKGEEAERRYRAALAVEPTHRQANYLLARRLVGRGELEEAARLLEETVRLEDELTPGYLRALAAVYARLGRTDQAGERLREAARQAEALGRSDLAAQVEADLARLPR